MSIIIRVRTQLGTWRLNDVQSSDTMGRLRERLEKEHHTDLEGRPFSADATGNAKFDDSQTIEELMFANGTMVYAMVDEEKTGIHEDSSAGTRRITKDGNIVAQNFDNVANREGFRPGMMPLRNMKMQWRLDEFMALDAQFEYKVSMASEPLCSHVKLDTGCMAEFQSYVASTLDFQQIRIGYLYGTYVDYKEPAPVKVAESASSSSSSGWGKKYKSDYKTDQVATEAEKVNKSPSVLVEFVYEPPQNNTDSTFELLEDPQADLVDHLAASLGLEKVGWIFAHPLREEKFNFSGREVIEAAEQQLIAAGGVKDTPFVTVKVTLDPKTNKPFADAFQISKQGMEMAAEGVLEPSVNLGMCAINSTFTAYVEGKPTKEVDTDFFIVRVPIQSFESELLVTQFPKANRLGVFATREDLKRQLSKAGSKGWTLQTQVSDFELLLYLCQFLDAQYDLPMICKSVLDKTIPVDEGHTLILRSLAGMD